MSDLLKNKSCLNAVAAEQSLASAVGGRDCVQAVSLCCLVVDAFFKLDEVPGACSDKLLL